jgi:hypothetical protein
LIVVLASHIKSCISLILLLSQLPSSLPTSNLLDYIEQATINAYTIASATTESILSMFAIIVFELWERGLIIMPGGFYNEDVNIDRLSIDFDNSNWHKFVYSVDGKIGSTTHGRDRLNG